MPNYSLPTLLPKSSSDYEVTVSNTISDAVNLDLELRKLWQPRICPNEFLPHLAWQFSVDYWNKDWTEDRKRAVIEAAFFVHQHKGTHSAIKRVISAFGYSCEIKEWFQELPRKKPGTFSLDISITDEGISEEIYNELYRLVFDAKPVSRHFFSFGLSIKNEGNIFTGASICDGEIINIYTDTLKEISIQNLSNSFVGQTEHEITNLYSKVEKELTVQQLNHTYAIQTEHEIIVLFKKE